MESATTDAATQRWFVLRDFRRSNANIPAYQQLTDAGFDVFTPLKWVVTTRRGEKIRRQLPIIPDMLFVRSTRAMLDAEVDHTPTLQYRYVRGKQATPMVVRDVDMHRFMCAVNASADTRYYLPEEITAAMLGRRVRIVGGPLDGYVGNLLYIRGAHAKRLIVEIPGLITAAVEVSPEFIQFV